jgi:hypothetical protein
MKISTFLTLCALLTVAPAIARADYDPTRYYSGSSGGGSGGSKAGYNTFVHGTVGYDVLKLASATGTASMGGLVYGGGVEPHISWGSVGLGTNIAFMLGKNLANGANTAIRKETLSSTDIQVTMRLRSGIMLLGLGPAIRYLTLTSINEGRTTETKYGAFGMRAEAGLRFVLFRYITVSPLFQYETLWANSSGGGASVRVNSYTPTLSIGITW